MNLGKHLLLTIQKYRYADTRLNGSGNYQTNQVGDDYRLQEFPNGTPITINTYYLRLIKA